MCMHQIGCCCLWLLIFRSMNRPSSQIDRAEIWIRCPTWNRQKPSMQEVQFLNNTASIWKLLSYSQSRRRSPMTYIQISSATDSSYSANCGSFVWHGVIIYKIGAINGASMETSCVYILASIMNTVYVEWIVARSLAVSYNSYSEKRKDFLETFCVPR